MFVTTRLMALVIIFVWQKNVFYARLFLLFFGSIKDVYLSSAMMEVPQGGWISLTLPLIFMFIMYVWHYGTRRKHLFDLQNKVSMKWIITLGPSLGVVRVPRIGLICTELVTGVPPIFSHFITNLPAFYQILVFICVKSVPVPFVPRPIRPNMYRMYRCIVRHGHKDVAKDDVYFENHMVMSIAEFIQMEGEETSRGDNETSVEGGMAVIRTSERFSTPLVMKDEYCSGSIQISSSKSETLQSLQALYEQELPGASHKRRVWFELPDSRGYMDR